jgi:hypothetical protein
METIKIANGDAKSGFTIINKADFDPKKHTEFGAEPAKKPAPKKPAAKKA